MLLGWAMLDGLLRDGFKLGDGIIFGLYIPNVAVNALAAATAIGACSGAAGCGASPTFPRAGPCAAGRRC